MSVAQHMFCGLFGTCSSMVILVIFIFRSDPRKGQVNLGQILRSQISLKNMPISLSFSRDFKERLMIIVVLGRLNC